MQAVDARSEKFCVADTNFSLEKYVKTRPLPRPKMVHLQIRVFASAPAAPPAIGSRGMGHSVVQAQGATGFSLLGWDWPKPALFQVRHGVKPNQQSLKVKNII